MPWVRIDDVFYDNVGNRALGPAGRDLFVAGLCYCAKGLTDGRIPKVDLPLILAQAQARKVTVAKLIDAGRWVDHGDWLEVVAYLNYQQSRAKVTADRAAAAERQRRAREKSSHADSHAVTHAPPGPALPSNESHPVVSPPLSAPNPDATKLPPEQVASLLTGIEQARQATHPTLYAVPQEIA